MSPRVTLATATVGTSLDAVPSAREREHPPNVRATIATLPEANKLVHDLRDLTQSLQAVSNRVNQQGIGGALGPEKLPDYKPGKRKWRCCLE